jgi:predicted NBD/HSP70 family sugar kinase
MRDLNERLVLSLVRQHGNLAKTEIARLTGLSAQTVSVIVRALETDGLLKRNEPVRGRIGQPSVPMSLNPQGAYFVGLKIGRRSADLVLIDFLGTAIAMRRLAYRYPLPDETVRFAAEGLQEVKESLPTQQSDRIAGMGIAMPFELWNWTEAAGASPGELEQWRRRDVRAEIEARCGISTYLRNDATSACGAELVFGQSPLPRDFIYFYLGTFPGGGIVLNGSLYPGPTGNAGALGSMPVPGSHGRTLQLIDKASIAILERKLIEAGEDASRLWTNPADWGDLGRELDEWIELAAEGIAHAIISACAVIDFQLAVIDGWMPVSVRGRIVDAVARKMGRADHEGLALPEVRGGTVGAHARAFGAASLPLSERFLYNAGFATGSA